MTVQEQLDCAVACKSRLAAATDQEKNRALLSMADALEGATEEILAANRADLEAAKGRVSPVMLDRLSLTADRIAAMADAIRAVTALADPVGRLLEQTRRPNGLLIRKVSVPLGVLAMIYESRPNVTSDGAALALKSGNVCILRGGKEALCSNTAIADALRAGIARAGLPADCLQLVADPSRESATALMQAVGKVDLLIPRGGAGLIRSCVENARVPCIQTGTGICHIYVDKAASMRKALAIVQNAKLSRPSVCNAMEVLLVHRDIASVFLPKIKALLVTDRHLAGEVPVELILHPSVEGIITGTPASAASFDTEFLDYKLAVRVVDSMEDAITHIAAHSTGHSEAIITEDEAAADRFTALVDSAAVYVNASTRFTDGGEFGLGCEMGISTQKLHARGPLGLDQLVSYKYVIRGNGQIR